MQALDDESFLTYLTEAMVRLYQSGNNGKNGKNTASIIHLYEDIAEYHDLTVPILTGQAVCHLVNSTTSVEAEKLAQEAFNKVNHLILIKLTYTL